MIGYACGTTDDEGAALADAAGASALTEGAAFGALAGAAEAGGATAPCTPPMRDPGTPITPPFGEATTPPIVVRGSTGWRARSPSCRTSLDAAADGAGGGGGIGVAVVGPPPVAVGGLATGATSGTVTDG